MNDKKKQHLKNYEVFAKFYDRMASKVKYQKWGEMIASVAKKYHLKNCECLEIACGTGNISAILNRQGFQVTGIDLSQYMLKIAKTKVPQATFIHADIRNFKMRGNKKFKLAISFYDSLNYLLTAADLYSAFRAVSNNLESGAIFLFDMNSTEHVEIASTFKPVIYEDPEAYIVIRYGKKRKLWMLVIDFFIKEKNKIAFYREKHFERGYDEKDVTSLLHRTGFELLDVQKEFKKNENNGQYLSRLYFIARKN